MTEAQDVQSGGSVTRKPGLHYWGCRIYCTVAMLHFYIAVVLYFVILISPGAWDRLGVLHIAAAVPLAVPAMFMLFNWVAFPWQYSVFGCFRRRTVATAGCQDIFLASWGQFGQLRATIPMVTWSIFSHGLGIRIEGIGVAYLPRSSIYAVEDAFPSARLLHHNCDEIRSPIRVPGRVYLSLTKTKKQ